MQEYVFHGLRYLIRYPKDFRENTQYPAILLLHGAGSRGTTTEGLRTNPFFQEIDQFPDFPFVVIAPLCHEHTWFEVWERLMALVHHFAGFPYIDETRLYLMGASMGGYGTWQLGMSLPEYFAAMVPICGGGMAWNAGRLVNIPVWAFHGAKDPTIPLEESQKMVDAVNAAGGNAKLTIYPENGHNAWGDTYSNPEVYRWMLQHRSKGIAAPADNYHSVQEHG